MSIDNLSKDELKEINRIYSELYEDLQCMKRHMVSRGVAGNAILNHERLEYRCKVMVDVTNQASPNKEIRNERLC